MRVTALLVCLVFLGVPAHAAPILFTDRAAFEEAVAPDHFTSEFSVTFVGGGRFAFDDGLLSTTLDSFHVLQSHNSDPANPFLLDSLGIGPLINIVGMGSAIPLLAFGFDLIPSVPSTVHFAGNFFQVTAPMFVGMVFDEPQTSFFWNVAQGGSVQIDNLTTRVPEPGTLGLFVVGALVLGLRRARRR